MIIGEVKTFPRCKLPLETRDQALKILEESAEVFSKFDDSWSYNETDDETWLDCVCSECADVIMAICNLLSLFKIEDMTPYMRRCEETQAKRGRYDLPELH